MVQKKATSKRRILVEKCLEKCHSSYRLESNFKQQLKQQQKGNSQSKREKEHKLDNVFIIITRQQSRQ